ncbi:MAG: thiaminase II [Alphaproteobacteria bacterium]|nr:thiaminase II [Alphaproteobacteria bacterium]
MTGFSDAAWARITGLRHAIHDLPFNRELAAGTLAPERFQGYITQDALYLGQYARCLAIAASKAPDADTLGAFAHYALGALSVEQALHERYFAEFGLAPSTLAQAEPAPDCLAYTSFLLATAYHEGWEVLVAALLPCFWIYWDVGRAIKTRAAHDNPYRAWIETYADPAFGAAVEAVKIAVDKAAAGASAATRARMLAAFIRSSQYEWLFWDGAYQRRGWPVGA